MADKTKSMLFELEKSLFDNEKISDSNWVDSIVHDDFREITQDGRIILKPEVLSKMAHCHSKLEFAVNNFECVQINQYSWLLYYIVAYANVQEYHTSVWVQRSETAQPQIILHQIAMVKDKVELIPYTNSTGDITEVL